MISVRRVPALVEEAGRPVPLLWPLGAAVATNPLWDLRDRPFADALARARQVLGVAGVPGPDLLADAAGTGQVTASDVEAALATEPWERHPDPAGTRVETTLARHDRAAGTALAAAADREVAKHCAAWVGGLVRAPAGAGFWSGWRVAVAADPAARRLGVDRLADELGPDPAKALAAALDRLGLDADGAAVEELTGQAARLPGWAAHAKWRSTWAAPDHPGPRLDLLDYLAVRLAYDVAALTAAGHRSGPDGCCDGLAPVPVEAPPVPPETAGWVGARTGRRLAALAPERAALVWLTAWEGHVRDRLLAALEDGGRDEPEEPIAQVVCCIDVRSEGLRRHLESLGPYQTFGFAGFFGIPARVWPDGSDEPLDLLPVLLRPGVELGEDDPGAERALRLAAAGRAADAGRKGALSAYLLAEAAGLALGPLAVLRTAAPRSVARLRGRRTAPPAEPRLDDLGDDVLAGYVGAALRTMGLTECFAPVVLVCGHGSTTANNPYASALDCGACGAARGGRSARMVAAAANRPGVRARLAADGIRVPDGTVFVAGEHDTATDTVTLWPPAGPGPAARAALERLGADLARAGAALAAERAASLPGAPRSARRPRAAARHVTRRAADWAQVQPEWGLAGCTAMVVGPRRLTAGVDLRRRVFLHSYEPERDPDGTALEAILTGPLVVAHWIAAAYYHSTVDPDVLGAGDKVAHNVVAGVGVWQGAGGDLRLGLPRQSVFERHRAHHDPLRLLAVVAAPRERIDAVVGRHTDLTALIEGAWVHLACRDANRWWLRRPGGAWSPWRPAAQAANPMSDIQRGG